MLRNLRLKQLQRFSQVINVNPFQQQLTDRCETNEYKPIIVQFTCFGQWRRFCKSSNMQKKYGKKSSSQDFDTDDEDETHPEFKDERDSKVVKTKVNSLRADLLLKAGLGIARNKIENIFYESKIRVNGKKLHKKSVQLNEGDEIDVIRGFSQHNPSHLVISRVVILSAAEREEGFSVNLRRYKSFLVENYSGANAFKSSISDH